MEPADKVAIVTGAGEGIGRAIAERLAGEAAAVFVVDVVADAAAETVRRIRAAGGTAESHVADLREPAAVERMVEAATNWRGGVDLLVNNAGGGAEAPAVFPEAAPEAWANLLELNLIAVMRAIQAVLPIMVDRGGGAVVNTGSVAGLGLAWHKSPEYAVAKAGLIRLTATLASLAAESNVRVNAIAPDWVGTERAYAELAALSAAARARATAQPLVPLDQLCDVVVELVRDDRLAGRVVRLDRGAAPLLLTAEERPDTGVQFPSSPRLGGADTPAIG